LLLFTGITCTRWSLNLNAHNDVMKDAQSYDFQEYVTMSCKRGFTGTNVSAQCIDVDKWSQPSPICKGKAFIMEMHKHRWGNKHKVFKNIDMKITCLRKMLKVMTNFNSSIVNTFYS
jgi:hypothetical protein